MEHPKEEHLVWAFKELYGLCGAGYDLLDRAVRVMAKYELDDEWYPTP